MPTLHRNIGIPLSPAGFVPAIQLFFNNTPTSHTIPKMAVEQAYYIGFDVGTGSGRACLVDRSGKLIAEHSVPTLTHRSPTDHRIFEQSTTNIWTSLSTSCREILKTSGVNPALVKGVGFDATCSLAVVNKSGQPVSVSRTGSSEDDENDQNLGTEVSGEEAWNVILWADHRAEAEAEQINATGEGVLGFVGKTMSVSRAQVTAGRR